MSDPTVRPTAPPPAGAPPVKAGSDEGRRRKLRQKDWKYLEAVRALRQVLVGRAAAVGAQQAQLAEFHRAVDELHEVSHPMCAQVESLARRWEQALAEERGFWEQFRGRMFDLLAAGGDPIHETLVRMAEHSEARDEARKAGKGPLAKQLNAALEAAYANYRELVARAEEAGAGPGESGDRHAEEGSAAAVQTGPGRSAAAVAPAPSAAADKAEVPPPLPPPPVPAPPAGMDGRAGAPPVLAPPAGPDTSADPPPLPALPVLVLPAPAPLAFAPLAMVPPPPAALTLAPRVGTDHAVAPQPPPLPPDPIEQLPVVEAWRHLDTFASRTAERCRARWPEAAYQLTVIPQTVKHLEQALRQERDLAEEARRKNLEEAAERRTTTLIATLCKLDVLVSGRNERGEPLTQPDGTLLGEVKEVRNLLFAFMSQFGRWREYSVKEGHSALAYMGRVDVVGNPMSAQQTIREVLHPGYIKEGGTEPSRKPRVILAI